MASLAPAAETSAPDDRRQNRNRPWRLVFRRGSEEPADVGSAVDDTPEIPMVLFLAYAEDCVLSGFVALDTDRLSDLLNESEEILLVDIQADDLADGSRREIAELLVARDELLLISAAGPRGSLARRIRTRQHLVTLTIGPYSVRGYLHCPPGAAPIASFRRRKAMVPLTEATVEYSLGGVQYSQAVESIIVNRHLVDDIEALVVEIPDLPDLPKPTVKGARVKDMTGHVWFGTEPTRPRTTPRPDTSVRRVCDARSLGPTIGLPVICR